MAKAAASAKTITEKEEWRPVVTWEGLYEVSDLGRVRSLDRATRFRCGCGHGEIIRNLKGRVLKPTYNIGYGSVQLTDGERRERYLVHRLVCRAFHGPAPKGRDQVSHNDGNPSNARADNLRWANQKENMADRWDHGTMLHGEDHPSSKITDAQVQEMRRHPELINADWAEKLGVSENHVSKIMVGALRARPSNSWNGEWLAKADRLPYGGLTARDKAYILKHPEMKASALAERFNVSVRRITLFRSKSREVRRARTTLSDATRQYIADNPDGLTNIEMGRRLFITPKQVAQVRYWAKQSA